jgi:hypothetical protein
VFEVTASWRGDEVPPASLEVLKDLGLIGENATFYDSVVHAVYVRVGEITLDSLRVGIR